MDETNEEEEAYEEEDAYDGEVEEGHDGAL